MKYKVLLTDIDGTLAPINDDPIQPNVPSAKIQAAIHQAVKHVLVGLVTARTSYGIAHFLPKLKLNCPLVLINGAEIIDPQTLKPIYRNPIKPSVIPELISLAEKHNISVGASNFIQDIHLKSGQKIIGDLADIYYGNVPINLVKTIEQSLKNIPHINFHKIPLNDQEHMGIDITDENATKQHAVIHLAKMLHISTEEIIGVGDSYNDFPLLMACGFRVAMGNATDDLKAIADFIAPSVDEDGVATVIEKFVLNHEI